MGHYKRVQRAGGTGGYNRRERNGWAKSGESETKYHGRSSDDRRWRFSVVVCAAGVLTMRSIFFRLLDMSNEHEIENISRFLHTSIPFTMAPDLPLTRSAWKDRLATLPGSPDAIPSFFFGHGSPLLAFSSDLAERDTRWHSVIKYIGPEGPLANFLRDFGPALLAKYQPKGILVFSAHWDTKGEKLGVSLPPLAWYFDVSPHGE